LIYINAIGLPPRHPSVVFVRRNGVARQDDCLCRSQTVSGIADASQELREVDQLLNDPDVALDARRVWSLLSDVKRTAQKPNSACVSAPD
jgi:hypothetical protein